MNTKTTSSLVNLILVTFLMLLAAVIMWIMEFINSPVFTACICMIPVLWTVFSLKETVSKTKNDYLKSVIDDAYAWQNRSFPKSSAIAKVLHLKDEVNELKQQLYIDEFQPEASDALRMEYADCFLLLYGSAYKRGLSYDDICKAIEKKMHINKSRKWGKPDENGVVKHVK